MKRSKGVVPDELAYRTSRHGHDHKLIPRLASLSSPTSSWSTSMDTSFYTRPEGGMLAERAANAKHQDCKDHGIEETSVITKI